MRFSLWTGLDQPWADVLDAATYADDGPWDTLYVADHFMPNAEEPDDGPMLECWTALTALAASTSRVGLGTLVCGNTYRHPTLLANMAATADIVSNGRLVLGLGAGWQVNEHTAYGLDFGTLKSRMDRFEESCAIITGLLRDRRTTVEGDHYTVVDAPCEPKPIGDVPLLVGGKGEQRTLRITARYAQRWNRWATPDDFAHSSGVLDQRCDEIDRDPSTIQRSTQALVFLSEDEDWLQQFRGDIGRPTVVGTPDEVAEQMVAFQAVGVDEFIIPDFTLGRGARRRDTLDLWRERVAPAVA